MKHALRLVALFLVVAASGCGERERGTVWQVSSISALMAGDYEGSTDCAELLKHGDFGLGTFDALDGEMIVDGGVVYRGGPDGVLGRVDGKTKTPFAAVTFFAADCVTRAPGKLDLAALERMLDAMPEAKNAPCAVRVDGVFRRVQIRTVPRQSEPYPRLSEAVRGQSVVEVKDAVGSLIGFRMPAWAEGVNVPGLHLHFISADRRSGGHVLSFDAEGAAVFIERCREIVVRVPDTKGFRRVNLTAPKNSELDRVEKPAGQ